VPLHYTRNGYTFTADAHSLTITPGPKPITLQRSDLERLGLARSSHHSAGSCFSSSFRGRARGPGRVDPRYLARLGSIGATRGRRRPVTAAPDQTTPW
jgi:hypothetical protein